MLFKCLLASVLSLVILGCPSMVRAQTSEKLKPFDFCQQIADPALQQMCQACGEKKVFTAFGCINKDQEGLSRDIINIVMGAAGGIALLSILAGSFVLSVSQGDTNKVKQAKSLITAAVSGLFFMVFSILVLKFIGVDILQIPGLS